MQPRDTSEAADSEDFTSNSGEEDSVSDEGKTNDGSDREEIVLTLQDDTVPVFSTMEKDNDSNVNEELRKQLSYLSIGHVPILHLLELTNEKPIFHAVRRMARKHHETAHRKLILILRAGIIVLAASAWSLPMVEAIKKTESRVSVLSIELRIRE